MSNIASSTYPVKTSTKSGDLFVIVRNGQLQKVNRAALEAYIKELSPGTLLSLTDAPNSYVGQQGKALVVNSTEDGMVFEPATAGNLLSLTDTPASYGAQAGKLLVVNTAENAMEFIDNFLIQLGDTPSSYTGASEKILRVNTGATAVEFVTPTEAAPTSNLTGGFFDYDHGGGTQSYTGGAAALKLLNDEAGTSTNKSYPPPGVTDVWDATANEFDWSELAFGDMVDIRLDLSVTTTAIDQTVDVDLRVGVGSGSEYLIPFIQNEFKAAGTYKVVRFNGIYMGDATTRDFPAYFEFMSDDNATIQVNGWYTRVIRRGA